MKDSFMKFTKEQLQDYRKRVQNYQISREFFESLYQEGLIDEIDFDIINLQLLKKYGLSERSVFNAKKKQKNSFLIFDAEYRSLFLLIAKGDQYDNRSKEFNP